MERSNNEFYTPVIFMGNADICTKQTLPLLLQESQLLGGIPAYAIHSPLSGFVHQTPTL